MNYYVYIVYRVDSVYVGKGHGDRWRQSLTQRKGIGCKIIAKNLTHQEALYL